jgi:hypothetical protein
MIQLNLEIYIDFFLFCLLLTVFWGILINEMMMIGRMDDNSNRHDYSKFQINLRFIFDPFCCLMKGKVKLNKTIMCVV